MQELLWHGRGGQGAFTAARLLGAAYIHRGAGFFALAFPSFGPERRGAPITAHVRLDEQPVVDRSSIQQSDYILYLDDTLFVPSAVSGLKPGGRVILNTKSEFEDERVIAIDASRIANEGYGLPVVNTAMLGALSAVSGVISLEDLLAAVESSFPQRHRAANLAAAEDAAKMIRQEVLVP